MKASIDKGETKRIPSIEVLVDNVNYGIFGISHDFGTFSLYRHLLSDIVEERDNWLTEQMLGMYLKPNEYTEVMDYSTNSCLDTFKLGSVLGLLGIPFSVLACGYLAYRTFNPGKSVENDIVRMSQDFKDINGLKKPYSHSTRRSAYQSEFMRAWKKGQDKNILVGANHVPEISYFLKNQIDDNMIINLASNHAELSERDPEKYEWIKRYYFGREAVFLYGGVFFGFMPWIASIGILKSL